MKRRAEARALVKGALLAGCLAVSGLGISVAGAAQCGTGIKLRLSADVARQGGLLLAEVTTADEFTALTGAWNNHPLEFWKLDTLAGTGGVRREALVGVDLEKPPGEYKVTVEALKSNGESQTCSATVSVKAGRFATERLHVDKKFVEPDPGQVQRSEEERKRLREIYAHTGPQPLWKGQFRRPLDSIAAGGNFGKRRVLNGKEGSPHTGMDFPAITGTPVHAAQAGRVMLAEDLFFSGSTVVVDHGLGIYTFYCHFSAIGVKVGDRVAVGDVLGKVGATGRVTGPHLHWGLTVEGSRVNPLEIVRLLGK